MDTGLVLIHFGEPPAPEEAVVERYLTRIFLQNADLESAGSEAERRARAEELAARRTPSLIDEYQAIGGSPLNDQAERQASDLAATLESRGYDIQATVAFQFIEPTIEDVLGTLQSAGIDRLIALPVYPLCGPSTTIAALDTVEETLAELGWDPAVTQISGWHRHPDYLRMRADNISAHARSVDIDLDDDRTTVIFSAHGTPQQYIEEGSRYVAYAEETCEAIARLAGIERYRVGYQNHGNRDIPWTEPDVEDLLSGMDVERVVVEPVSFMHEQSETLVDLDIELAEAANERSLGFERVPVPHDDETFPNVLADVVEPTLAGVDPALFQLRQCRCKPSEGTVCLNAPAR